MTEIRDDNGDVPVAAEGANLLDKYELGRLLGCGAFAKVYHGRNRRTGQNVAIKVVSKQKVLKGGLTAHIKREIDILSRLRHPHIVRLHEILATKTKIYFILEFAKGGELFAKVAKGRFTEDLSRRYFQQLISVIGYCHSRGVYHRDLKPENLLLDENWDLKVTDFGLSAVTDQIQPDGLLHTLCGTPAYVAPEILTKKGYDGAKVDIWSCGIILFVLNAGYLPFNDPNLMVMYRKIYKGEFRCPKWTSPDLKRFLTRLLDTNPQNRITVEEMVNDPWFKIGYKEIKFHEEHLDLKDRDDDDDEKHLNAFDIISFSPGVDLSGLFNRPNIPAATKRFVSAESPDKIIDKLEAAAQTEGLTAVKKKRCGAVIEGQNGNFTGLVEIYQLTEKLVVVQVKHGGGISGQTWKDKLWPQLSGLIYQPARQVTGN